jgi:hypothetical protein
MIRRRGKRMIQEGTEENERAGWQTPSPRGGDAAMLSGKVLLRLVRQASRGVKR